MPNGHLCQEKTRTERGPTDFSVPQEDFKRGCLGRDLQARFLPKTLGN